MNQQSTGIIVKAHPVAIAALAVAVLGSLASAWFANATTGEAHEEVEILRTQVRNFTSGERPRPVRPVPSEEATVAAQTEAESDQPVQPTESEVIVQ